MNNTYKLIVDYNDLKNLGFIDENISEKKSNIIIKSIQDIHLQTALSTQLYKELIEQCNNGQLLPHYQYLIDEFIIFAVGHYVKSELMLENTYKLRNNSVTKTFDSNSDYSALNEVKFLQQESNNKAEWYVNRMIKFIKDNLHLFPEYNVIINNNSDIVGDNSGFDFNLIIGKKY